MDLFDLHRPDHLDQPGWDAIERARDRLRLAWEMGDLPEVVGKAKELVETVAKATVASVDGAVSDAADFGPTVNAAQKSLKRQPGKDLSQDQNIRAISNAAQNLVSGLAPLRNSHGTGHGRAREPHVALEMASMALESALLWTRWALRRLEHLLADYPNDLIDAVQTGTPRGELRSKFEAVTLAQQPAGTQHRIGVAFGQQSAGGFGNATEVGVDPVIDGGYENYPIDYRRGLLEGMLLNYGGAVGLPEFYAPRFVSLVASLPEGDAAETLEHLRTAVAGAPWSDSWRGTTQIEPPAVITTLRNESGRLGPAYLGAFVRLCDELEATACS